MEKELALRTIGYLIGYYKTHEETTINSQEIEAIDYMLDENEKLETQLKKQQEINQKAIEFIKENKYLNWYVESCYTDDLLQILEEKEKQFDRIGDPINSGACCGILAKYKKVIGNDINVRSKETSND